MGTVRRLAEEVGRGPNTALPNLCKTVVRKVALAVEAMIEVRTPNMAELTNVLPLETARQDMREQWLRRLSTIPCWPARCCWSRGRARRWPRRAGKSRR